MPQAGEIYSYPEYEFPDGDNRNKYVVVMGQIPGGDWILGRTTSRQYGRPKHPACNQSEHYPSYYLETAAGVLPLESWVVLDRLDDHDEKVFNEKVESGRVELVGRFRSKTSAACCPVPPALKTSCRCR